MKLFQVESHVTQAPIRALNMPHLKKRLYLAQFLSYYKSEKTENIFSIYRI